MRLSSRPARRSSGFTLVEMLVVMAIIATLLSLGASAYFRIEQTQNMKRTEATIKKVASGLNSQWNAVIDEVKNEQRNGKVPASVLTLAGNDRDRANALWMKMRLKQEFPQSFAEAKATYLGLAGKQFYIQSLSGAPTTIGGPSGPAKESAICLYLALSQARRGASVNVDEIGVGSTDKFTYSGNSWSFFVDSWGNPICFEHWMVTPTPVLSPDVLNEFSAPPYAAPNDKNKANRDPQDPESKLFGWSDPTVAAVFPPFDGKNRSPVVYSFGQDKKAATGDDILSFRLLREGLRGD